MDISSDFLKTVYDNLRLKSKILAILFFSIVFIQGIVLSYIFIGGHNAEYHIPGAIVLGPLFIALAGMAEIYAARFFKRKLTEPGRMSSGMLYVFTAIEVSLPTCIFLFIFMFQGSIISVSASQVLTSPPFVMYFIMISLSALLMNVKLSVFAGALAGVQYLLLSLYYFHVNSINGLDRPNTFARALLLAVFGVIMGFISRKILESVRSSLDSKNKLINELDGMVKEKTKEIHQQKEELVEKNKDITDSINYAKNIQDAILPDLEDITAVWKDLFIFYQPKDIVSGDFYWFKKIDDHRFLIACCDCTGHGVPGAFMSVLCSSKLHEASSVSTEPDELLFHANNSIKENLGQQRDGRGKDGMEICLMSIDTRTKEVKYAGANRALWIYNDEDDKLSEIKPTKASIASSTDFNFKYQLHTLKLKAGDILYAASDGYADQFGGKADKKYMAKNFKSLLVKKAKLQMKDQCDELRSNINNWMGNHEQVDDLLVIGIRL
jgi:serine phosphatase RsbU (regulator of sigma subunit)